MHEFEPCITKKILENSDTKPVLNQAKDTIKNNDASSAVSLEIYQPVNCKLKLNKK